MKLHSPVKVPPQVTLRPRLMVRVSRVDVCQD